jgi:hypothetical protein
MGEYGWSLVRGRMQENEAREGGGGKTRQSRGLRKIMDSILNAMW